MPKLCGKIISTKFVLRNIAHSVGGFATQIESRRIIILEANRFYIWKVHGK